MLSKELRFPPPFPSIQVRAVNVEGGRKALLRSERRKKPAGLKKIDCSEA